MELRDAILSRRMTRDFVPSGVDRGVIDDCISLALRAPSAGKTQGWHVVGMAGADTSRYWDAALPHGARANFAFPGLLNAGFIGVFLADPGAYVSRYSEDDKAATGLGRGVDAWPAPYWTVDTSMAVMTFLLALEDHGLGALFFAVAHEADVREALGIPSHLQVIGAVAAGEPAKSGGRAGRSAGRPSRSASDVISWGGWRPVSG